MRSRTMKKLAAYWLPPLVWMACLFPVGNKALASSRTYRIFIAVYRWFVPRASRASAELGYVIMRKSLHFLAYGFLAYLFYRAFRAGTKQAAKAAWLAPAAAAAIGYGFLDEFLQSFVPHRTGSALDWAIDSAGVVTFLAITAARSRKAALDPAPPRPNEFRRALFLKRPFDIALSSLGLILSSPLWVVISLAVRLEDRGPIFYAQERVGRGGKLFKALKFRSMIRDAEKDQGPVQAVEKDPRVTKVGRILRATAMDELPQLLNIFLGDMSFVGPRALRPNEREVHGDPDRRAIEEIEGFRERHAVRPGLTGLTQVFLPGDTPRRKKFRCDLLYIRKQSFWLDLKLIFLSFWITLRGKWESRQDKI
jgi:lipopolysaccharide/colanic/teichoic acid biosynthesis glycosyltransferase